MRLLTAIRFLTIIPMPRPRNETVEHMVRAAASILRWGRSSVVFWQE